MESNFQLKKTKQPLSQLLKWFKKQIDLVAWSVQQTEMSLPQDAGSATPWFFCQRKKFKVKKTQKQTPPS